MMGYVIIVEIHEPDGMITKFRVRVRADSMVQAEEYALNKAQEEYPFGEYSIVSTKRIT